MKKKDLPILLFVKSSVRTKLSTSRTSLGKAYKRRVWFVISISNVNIEVKQKYQKRIFYCIRVNHTKKMNTDDTKCPPPPSTGKKNERKEKTKKKANKSHIPKNSKGLLFIFIPSFLSVLCILGSQKKINILVVFGLPFFLFHTSTPFSTLRTITQLIPLILSFGYLCHIVPISFHFLYLHKLSKLSINIFNKLLHHPNYIFYLLQLYEGKQHNSGYTTIHEDILDIYALLMFSYQEII